MQCRRRSLYAFPARLSGKHKLLIHSFYVFETLQVGFHDTISGIITRRERQPAPRHKGSAKGSVSVLLAIMIIDASGVLILRILCVVTQIFVGVLGVRLEAEPFEELFLIACLHKEIAVPLPAYIRVLVRQTPDDTSRAAALAVVIVNV